MNHRERQAVAEALESYFTPDSPEGLACAMYQLRKVYESAKTQHGAPPTGIGKRPFQDPRLRFPFRIRKSLLPLARQLGRDRIEKLIEREAQSKPLKP